MSKIHIASQELHKAFKLLNHYFFDSNLPEVALTIQTRGKHLAYGWFTPYIAWQDQKQNVQLHEINISAESLSRPYIEIMQTLLHEMVHLYCHVNDIKDTSRGGTYHNKHFKIESEKHGFYYNEPVDKKHGWTFSKLTPESIKVINAFDIQRNAFLVSRNPELKRESKNKSFKWECPTCNDKIRSTKKDIQPICGKCSNLKNYSSRFQIVYFIMDDVDEEEEQY